MYNIIKEDDEYLYINASEATQDGLVWLKDHCKAIGKKLWDLESDSRKYITYCPNSHYFLRSPTQLRHSKAEVRRAILIADKPSALTIGKALGVSTFTANRYIEKYNLRPLMDKVRMDTIDKVENKLVQVALDEGDVRAMKLYLDAHAKDRGYGGNKPTVDANINVKLVFEDPDTDEE